MEYFAGPVIAALIGAAGLRKVQLQDKKIKELQQQLEQVEVETSKKVLAVMFPVTKAVKELKETVGV
jgi:Na+/melibiose symporter-like transporter